MSYVAYLVLHEIQKFYELIKVIAHTGFMVAIEVRSGDKIKENLLNPPSLDTTFAQTQKRGKCKWEMKISTLPLIFHYSELRESLPLIAKWINLHISIPSSLLFLNFFLFIINWTLHSLKIVNDSSCSQLMKTRLSLDIRTLNSILPSSRFASFLTSIRVSCTEERARKKLASSTEKLN